MLIDEADIYMEERQTQDLNRKHLVAGFLRALEYFKGILFLTTNRVGTFDEAFISRIHVPIYYAEFQDEQRIKIWGRFSEKLEEDREATMRILQSTKDYIQSQELQELKWNGREIRNGELPPSPISSTKAEHQQLTPSSFPSCGCACRGPGAQRQGRTGPHQTGPYQGHGEHVWGL